VTPSITLSRQPGIAADVMTVRAIDHARQVVQFAQLQPLKPEILRACPLASVTAAGSAEELGVSATI
jgi:hypothetical protein